MMIRRVVLAVALALAVGAIGTTGWILGRPAAPSISRCADELVNLGLRNAEADQDAVGQARPQTCSRLSESEYSIARHDAAVRLASLLGGR